MKRSKVTRFFSIHRLELIFINFGLILCMILVGNTLYSAPKSDLWPKWEAHNPAATETINHQSWSKFLTENLISNHESGVNRLNYATVSKTVKGQLNSYIDYLQSIKITDYNRKEQKAYWINFYNALTVKVILDHYPVKSILDIDISSGWFSNGPWDAKLVEVEGQKLSLNDMEHRILRPIWKDNRIHYAVNCASIGCPNLSPEVFTAGNSDQLLDKSASDYINHSRGVMLIEEDEIKVSSIFDWYAVDFGDSDKALIDHILKYANQQLTQQLNDFDGDIDYDYNWNLNAP